MDIDIALRGKGLVVQPGLMMAVTRTTQDVIDEFSDEYIYICVYIGRGPQGAHKAY